MDLNPYQIPQSELDSAEPLPLGGPKLGALWLGIPVLVVLLGGETIGILSDAASGKPAPWSTYLVLALLFAWIAALGSVLGSLLGKRLEPGGWWKGVGWSLLAGLAWGPSSVLSMSMARLAVALFQREPLGSVNLFPFTTATEWTVAALAGLAPTLPCALGLGLHLRHRRRKRR